MMQSQPTVRLAAARLLLVASMLIVPAACTLHIAPDYSPETADAIVATERQIDQFYAHLRTVAEDQRKFQAFAQAYGDVEVEIHTLILRTQIQSFNQDSTHMAQTILDLWQKIEAKHKQKDGYSDALAEDDQVRLDNFLTSMAIVNQPVGTPAENQK